MKQMMVKLCLNFFTRFLETWYTLASLATSTSRFYKKKKQETKQKQNKNIGRRAFYKINKKYKEYSIYQKKKKKVWK